MASWVVIALAADIGITGDLALLICRAVRNVITKAVPSHLVRLFYQLVVLLLGVDALGGPQGESAVDALSPFRTEIAALSPDGNRVAYAVREGEEISIITIDLESPSKVRTMAKVAADRLARDDKSTRTYAESKIWWLRWITDERVVCGTDIQFFGARGARVGGIYGFDYNGQNARELYSAREADESILVSHLSPGPEAKLLIPRAKSGWVRLDAFSGAKDVLSKVESAQMPQVVDQWERDLKARQGDALRELQNVYPDYAIVPYGYSESSGRLLALVQNMADAGSFVVYDSKLRRGWDVAARAPGLRAVHEYQVIAFDLQDKQGERFTGSLVLPKIPRTKRVPLILWAPDRFELVSIKTYHPGIRALADMGFAVAVVDGGFPSENLQDRAVRLARIERDGAEPSSTPVVSQPEATKASHDPSHALRALDALADKYPVSRTAVALFSRKMNATQALLETSRMPGRIRCVVAVEPHTLDIMADRAGRFSAVSDALAKASGKPCEAALILGYPGRPGLHYGKGVNYLAARAVNADLRDRGVKSSFRIIEQATREGDPRIEAEMFEHIRSFLNEHLYQYSVSLGETVILEGNVPSLPGSKVPEK